MGKQLLTMKRDFLRKRGLYLTVFAVANVIAIAIYLKRVEVSQYVSFSQASISIRQTTLQQQVEQIENQTEINTAESVVQRSFPCDNSTPKSLYRQRGKYTILYNYVLAERRFNCDESITYTTHGDFTFLDNLETLTNRWQGPVSIAVFAPGVDLNVTLTSIQYLRTCRNNLVKQLVTFHIFFEEKFPPKFFPKSSDFHNWPVNCSVEPWKDKTSFRHEHNQKTKDNLLLYPVNVARNVARLAATTHFVLPSDVELYPSLNVIPMFLDMVKRNLTHISESWNHVYMFPIFEVKSSVEPPDTKLQLQKMLKSKDAIYFHKSMCSKCHSFPGQKEWENETPSNVRRLDIFRTGKRQKPFQSWEPIYIGTQKEPLYDERLSWEGKSDKMTQMYALCMLDYDIAIVDNSFLVHRPGIKKYHKDSFRDKVVAKQTSLINKVIATELYGVYGQNKQCSIR